VTARTPNPRGAGEQLREQLVDAAAAMLSRPRGVPAPSLRAVARAVGVSPTAVYLHFDSQADLVRAVLERHLQDLGRALRADVDDPASPVHERMTRRASAYVAWGLQHPGAYQLLFESADALDVGEHSPTGAELIGDVAASLVESAGVDPDRARVAATRIWTGLHGIVSLRLHKPHQQWPTSLDDDVRTVVALHLASSS
jgi:AcrR family transcriptional regulator